jgi:quinol monooxygenase YgiN
MGRFAIVAYKPKPGKEQALVNLTREHVAIFRNEGLVTDRAPYAMRAADGTVVEVFEWKSKEAIAAAHDNPVVQAMWERYGEACEYVCLGTLAESKNLFAEFDALELRG